MERILAIALCLMLCGSAPLRAEDVVTPSPVPAANAEEVKAQATADQAKVSAEREAFKKKMDANRTEEQALRKQMLDATKAGDQKKAAEIREQLKTLHQANVTKMKADLKTMQQDKKVVRTEKAQAKKMAKVEAKGKEVKGKKKGWFGWGN